jgi:hypothetical protein
MAKEPWNNLNHKTDKMERSAIADVTEAEFGQDG